MGAGVCQGAQDELNGGSAHTLGCPTAGTAGAARDKLPPRRGLAALSAAGFRHWLGMVGLGEKGVSHRAASA